MDKILFFDVDGTLYNSEKKLPNSSKQAIWQAKENGHEIAIATGRSPFMIAPLLQELAIDTYVTFNGQFVVHNGEVIHKGGVDRTILSKIIAFGNERNEPFVFIDDKQMVASIDDHPFIRESIHSLKFPYPYIDANYYLANEVYQTLIFVEEHQDHFYRHAFPEVDFVRWHRYSCDILPKYGSKAKGIELLLNKIGKTKEDIIVFGDGLNDVEMFKFSTISVAMGNSHERVKEIATHIAGHVDEDGLANIMKELRLI